MAHPLIGLRIPADLVQEMKVRALKEKRSVQSITEELWRGYLKLPAAKPVEEEWKKELKDTLQNLDVFMKTLRRHRRSL